MTITFDELDDIRSKHAGQKLVLTTGTFDLFHVGHLEYLEQVKRYGDVLVVMMSGDDRVRARKGPKRPIIPEQDRARILDALKIVDYVFLDPSKMSPEKTDPIHAEILRKLQPDFYVTDGPDPRFVNIMDEDSFKILDRMRSDPSTTGIVERVTKRYA